MPPPPAAFLPAASAAAGAFSLTVTGSTNLSWSSMQTRSPDLSAWVVPAASSMERDLQISMLDQTTASDDRALNLAKNALGILAEGRRSKDALRDLDEAIRIDPECALGYYGRGRCAPCLALLQL